MVVSGPNIFVETTTKFNEKTGKAEQPQFTPNTGVTFRGGGTFSQSIGSPNEYLDIANAQIPKASMEAKLELARRLQESAKKQISADKPPSDSIITGATGLPTGGLPQMSSPINAPSALSQAATLQPITPVGSIVSRTEKETLYNYGPPKIERDIIGYSGRMIGKSEKEGFSAFPIPIYGDVKKPNVIGEREIEKTRYFYKTSTGELYALPVSAGGAKKALLETRLQEAEKKGSITGNLVGRILTATGFGAVGSVAQYREETVETDLTPAETVASTPLSYGGASSKTPVVTDAQKARIVSTLYPKIERPKSSLILRPTPNPQPVIAERNKAASNAGLIKAEWLTPEEVKGKEFYDRASTVQKGAIVINILGTSKEGFNLAGSALINAPDKEKKLYAAIYKKMIERKEQEDRKESRIEGAVKSSFGALVDSETISGTAVQGAALGYGLGAIGELAPIASRIPVAGKTIVEAGNLFAKHPKFTEAAIKGVGIGFIGYSGYEPYSKSKEAGESESTALSRGTSGALKAAVFIGGAKVGSDLYKRFPSPIKGADIEVPTQITKVEKIVDGKKVVVPKIETERAYTGLTLELPRELPAGLSNKVVPLIGKSEKGGFVFGRFPKGNEVPSLSLTKNLDKVALNLETPAQAQFYTSPETLKALKPVYTVEAELEKAGLLPVVQYGAGVVVTPTGKLPTKTLSAGENVKIILDELKKSGKSFVLKGSYSAKAKLQNKFTDFEARDIDANIEMTPAEATALRQKILTRLKNEATGEYKFSAAKDGYGITSVNPQGIEGHALDLKLKGETFVEPSPYTVLSSTGDTSRLGISVTNQPTELVEGFKTQSLAEQGTRKAGTSLTLLFDKGKFTFAPEVKGRVAKDVADVLPIYYRLLEVRGGSPALYGRVQTFTKSYLKTGQLTEADLATRGLGIEPKTGKIVGRPELLEGKSDVKIELANFQVKKPPISQSKIILTKQSVQDLTRSGVRIQEKVNNYGAVNKKLVSGSNKPASFSLSKLGSSGSPAIPSQLSPSAPSQTSPSISSPSRSPPYKIISQVSSSQSSSGYNYYSKSSKSSYGFGSNYLSKSGYNYPITSYGSGGGGGGGSGNGGRDGVNRKSVARGVSIKQKFGLFPSLFSITRQQQKTGSFFYRAPSKKAILKSSVYRRSGGELVPTGEQLKEPSFSLKRFLFSKRKGQSVIFNLGMILILLLFFVYSLDTQLVAVNNFVNNVVGGQTAIVIMSFFSFFLFASIGLNLVSNKS